jgi:hypothetical protein
MSTNASRAPAPRAARAQQSAADRENPIDHVGGEARQAHDAADGRAADPFRGRQLCERPVHAALQHSLPAVCARRALTSVRSTFGGPQSSQPSRGHDDLPPALRSSGAHSNHQIFCLSSCDGRGTIYRSVTHHRHASRTAGVVRRHTTAELRETRPGNSAHHAPASLCTMKSRKHARQV